MKKAKVVCTIGPASRSKKIIASLIKDGMDVARLNFSHGTHEKHRDYINTIRLYSNSTKKPIAILQDLQGIKLRVGRVKNGVINLKTGREIDLCEGNKISTESCLFVPHASFIKDLDKGDRILINDGLIILKVKGKTQRSALLRIIEGGEVTEKKGINLPDTHIRLSSFTGKDKRDLDFGMRMGVDYVAVSFVRTAQDIMKVKNHIKRNGHEIPVIAKIEKPEALENIDAIINTVDGVMIARGDLGVEMNPEEVPIIQKQLIQRANKAGKLVITATQMLESMTEHLRPTRAEVADVANAVIDGTDALMLSAETSSGKHPVQAVKMMCRIIEQAEKNYEMKNIFTKQDITKADYPYAVADAAVRAARDVKARAVVAFTHSGYTARLVSKFRPSVPIIAFATEETIQRHLALLWGVTPFLMKPLRHTDEMVVEVQKFLLKNRYVRRGDTVVIIASSPLSISGKTNFMKLHKISK